MDFQDTLENIGLKEKEAKLYLALLELKEALPSVLAKKTGIKRPTTYLILEQLEKQGFVSKVKKGRQTYYQAVNPHHLLEQEYLRYQNLEAALPGLLNLHEKYSVKPQVSFFEGEKGLIHIMEDTLTTSTELLCWGDVKMIFSSFLQDYYPSYIKKKVARKVWLRGIFPYDEEALGLKHRGKEELREVYLIPKEDYPFKNEINIYDDKVAIISHEDKIGVIIQNQNIADTQRSIFNFAFKYAKIAEAELLKRVF